MEFRIGQGIDIHPFAEDRKLILGGVEIPSDRGLQGHSDADALTHAVCDALLGAASLGDIGKQFPDSDPKYKGASSLTFLKETMQLVREKGWNVSNIDATIVTEAPKMAPHIEKMQQSLGKTMDVSPDRISLKATRFENLGTLGRGEGLMVQAVALLFRQSVVR